MKTFEERYTAWIDGRLDGGALGAFEQELARRAAATEAKADKADAGRLRLLLRGNLQAPVLTNGEFFSLQVRERIEAERAASRRSEPIARGSWLGWFAGPVTRVIGIGAAALFVVGALYYGMIPLRTVAPTESAKNSRATVEKGVTPERFVAEATSSGDHRPRAGNNLMVKIDPPEEIDDESPGFAARVPDPATTHATATPLHYRDANVNVLWINGLDYMANVPQDQPTPPAAPALLASPAPAPAPATATAVPHHG